MKAIEGRGVQESKREKWLEEAIKRIRNGRGTESKGQGTVYTRNLPGPRSSRSRYINYWVTKKRLQRVEKGIYAENDWDPLEQQLLVHSAEVVLDRHLTWEDMFDRENTRRIAASMGMSPRKIAGLYDRVLRLRRESIEKSIAKAFVMRLGKSNPQSDNEDVEDMVITPFSEGYLRGPLSRRAEEKMMEASRWHFELARKYESEALSRFYGHPV